jgi:uncharacterized protein (DUF362 family)
VGIMSRVSIVEGEEPEDMVSEAIDLLGGIDKFIRFGDVVFIKPNVCGGVVGKRGSYTSPEVITALLVSCQPYNVVSYIRYALHN